MMHKYDIVTSIDGEIVVSVMPNLLLIIYTYIVYSLSNFNQFEELSVFIPELPN